MHSMVFTQERVMVRNGQVCKPVRNIEAQLMLAQSQLAQQQVPSRPLLLYVVLM